MDSGIFFGGSVVAAVVAGMIALFAPCCISVMLPAYFASSFQNRGLLVAMTFLYSAGIATIILPLALGAAALRQLITIGHTPIYLVGGLLMLGLAAYTVLGGQVHLPMPGREASGNTGPLGVYSLGVFSGIATSCCAPVLAGVVALAGVASSFGLALGLGVAYVFGMVAPLFVLSLLWDQWDWRSSSLFRPRTFSWRLAGRTTTLSLTALASAVLLGVMGAATMAAGFTDPDMAIASGWEAELVVRLQGYGRDLTEALSAAPGWLAAAIVALALALLGRRAARELGWTTGADTSMPGAEEDVEHERV